MRKRVLFFILAPILIVGSGFVAQSCLQSAVLQRASDDTGDGLILQITVPSGVSTSNAGLTKAGYEDGSEAESTINDLYIYLYTKSGNSGWTNINTIQPDVSTLSSSESGVYTVEINNAHVTTEFLQTSDNRLLAVVYANSIDGALPSNISSENDFWSGGSLNNLFFSGSDVFTAQEGGSYYADVELKRQVAKLRVKATISDDAIPSDLAIDLTSVKIEVSNMADNSDISVGLEDGDPKAEDNSYNISQNINRSATYNGATALRHSASSATSITMSDGEVVLDSLYMHPIPTAANESSAIKVNLSMVVSSASSGYSTTIEEEVYLEPDAVTGYSYATTRNTIYTLNFIVRTIEDVTCELELEGSSGDIEWSDGTLDPVDVATGEIKISDNPIEVNINDQTTFTIIASTSFGSEFTINLVDSDYSDMEATDGLALASGDNDGVSLTLATGTTHTVTMRAATDDAGTYYLKIEAGDLTKYVEVTVIDPTEASL